MSSETLHAGSFEFSLFFLLGVLDPSSYNPHRIRFFWFSIEVSVVVEMLATSLFPNELYCE